MTKMERIKHLEGIISGCRVFVAQATLKENGGSHAQRQDANEWLQLIDYALDKTPKVRLSDPGVIEQLRKDFGL